jgi:hypothetical protein
LKRNYSEKDKCIEKEDVMTEYKRLRAKELRRFVNKKERYFRGPEGK